MNTTVAARAPTLPGLLPDVEALRLAESFRTYEEYGQAVLDRMPTADEKQAMTRRSQDIASALKLIGDGVMAKAEAAEIIAGLLVGYGYARGDKAAAQTVTVYVKHLETVPLFAIRAACEDVKAGRVFDVDRRTGNRVPLSPDKEPSTVRLRAVAQKHVDALLAEQWKFDRVLRAKRALPPPVPEAERARIAAKFANLGEDLKAATADDDLERENVAARVAERMNAARDEDILAEYARLGVEPVRSGGLLVSPELARRTGRAVAAQPESRNGDADFYL
jgi:hypothetical protein